MKWRVSEQKEKDEQGKNRGRMLECKYREDRLNRRLSWRTAAGGKKGLR